MRNSIAIAFIIISGLITGCASVPMAPIEHDQKAKSFAVEPGKSNIYVYRNETFGGSVIMLLTLDGKVGGRTASKTYVKWVVDPGEHEVTSVAENTYKILVNAKEGKNHFVWQEVKMGAFMARSKLHNVSEEAGRKGVLECKLIQPEL